MIIFKTVADLKAELAKLRIESKAIGYVPTMGALHKGHLALVAGSKAENDVTVCSIFVNPTQFNSTADFEKYPLKVEDDIKKLEATGCDILFLPSVAEVYPGGTELKKEYDLGYLEEILEGEHRPGHFQGVCQVVHRLLDIVEPNNLYLGQKDYQQCMIIKKLISLIGSKAEVNILPTTREENGLAMSSRNLRLTPEQKEDACAIYEAMYYLQTHFPKRMLSEEEFDAMKEKATAHIAEYGFDSIDYFEICNANTMKPLRKWDGSTKILAACAAHIGDIRLIDNMPLN